MSSSYINKDGDKVTLTDNEKKAVLEILDAECKRTKEAWDKAMSTYVMADRVRHRAKECHKEALTAKSIANVDTSLFISWEEAKVHLGAGKAVYNVLWDRDTIVEVKGKNHAGAVIPVHIKLQINRFGGVDHAYQYVPPDEPIFNKYEWMLVKEEKA